MMPPAARVRALAALVLDAAETHGRTLHPQAAHAAVSRLLEEGRTPAAILAAAAVAAADPAPGRMGWPDDPGAWTATPPPATDAARCRVCGHTAHRCARLAAIVAPTARHPFTPTASGPTPPPTSSGPTSSGRPCADCGQPVTIPNRVRCAPCAAATFATPTPSPGATTSSATRPATARAALDPTPPTHPDPIGRQTAAQPPRKEPPTP